MSWTKESEGTREIGLPLTVTLHLISSLPTYHSGHDRGRRESTGDCLAQFCAFCRLPCDKSFDQRREKSLVTVKVAQTLHPQRMFQELVHDGVGNLSEQLLHAAHATSGACTSPCFHLLLEL